MASAPPDSILLFLSRCRRVHTAIDALLWISATENRQLGSSLCIKQHKKCKSPSKDVTAVRRLITKIVLSIMHPRYSSGRLQKSETWFWVMLLVVTWFTYMETSIAMIPFSALQKNLRNGPSKTFYGTDPELFEQPDKTHGRFRRFSGDGSRHHHCQERFSHDILHFCGHI